MRYGNPVLLVGLSLAFGIQADDFAVTNQFQADTPAVAAEVNQNFNDVAAAINALTDRVAALEAVNNGSDCADGRTSGAYDLVAYRVALGRAPGNDGPDYIHFELEYEEFDVCLHSDGTAWAKVTRRKDVGEDNSVDTTIGQVLTGTYSLSSTCALTLNVPQGEDPVYLSGTPSLETFTGGETDFDDLIYQGQDVGDSNGQTLFVMTKTMPGADHQCTPH